MVDAKIELPTYCIIEWFVWPMYIDWKEPSANVWRNVLWPGYHFNFLCDQKEREPRVLSISPTKPVSPALPLLPLMESTFPAGDCGNVNQRCRVCRRGDVNGKRPYTYI